MKNSPNFLLLIMLAIFGVTTSCESQDTLSTVPFSAEDVASSTEWANYATQTKALITYFANPNSVDLDRVHTILENTQDLPDGEEQFKKRVSEIEGGAEYLLLNKRIDQALDAVYQRFDRQILNREMRNKVREAYREIRLSQTLD